MAECGTRQTRPCIDIKSPAIVSGSVAQCDCESVALLCSLNSTLASLGAIGYRIRTALSLKSASPQHLLTKAMAWRLLAACALSAVVASGSARTAPDDGICNRLTQYVPLEGRPAVAGTTLTYCASESECRRTADKICCHGWRRDPDSKKLRCIKMDPSDAVDAASALGNGEGSASVHGDWSALSKEADVQNNVRRPRDSPPAPVNAPVGSSRANSDQGAGNVQNPQQGLQNLPARGDGADHSGQVAGPQSKAGSAANSDDPQKPPPSPSINDTRQEPSKNVPATTSGQSTSRPSHPEGPPPLVTPPDSKNTSGSHSATGHSDAAALKTAKKEDSDQHGGSSQTTSAAVPASSPVPSAPPAATSVAPQTTVQTAATPSAVGTASGPTAHAVTPATSPAGPVGAGSGHTAVSSPATSSTTQSTQDAGLVLTGTDLRHELKEDTIPLSGFLESTSAPPTSTTTTTNNNNTNTNVSAVTTTNATAVAASNQQNNNATHHAQNEMGNSNVHTGPSATSTTTYAPTSTSAPTTLLSTQNIPHGGNTPASVANASGDPAQQHPNVQAGSGTIEYKVAVKTSSTPQGASPGNPSVAVVQRGGASAANSTGKNDSAANTTGKNDSSDIPTGKNDSAANCTAAGHAPNCTLLGHPKNSSHSNDTATAVRPQPRAGTPEPSDGGSSKTASEVTISLLLVAAVAFVAALVYWRTRRRRRRYINCGTREPNLHFSNPVYDLEAMMEQTSLVKLQNAADIEDATDDSDREPTLQKL